MSSSQIMQRSIVREKLKAQQPDIYIDVEVDEFYVLDFHRFKDILAAAAPAKEQLRRQLARVLASQTRRRRCRRSAARRRRAAPTRKRRLPGLKQLRAVAKADAMRKPGEPHPRIALALGGGSARGLAHVVMLEAFDELGVKPASSPARPWARFAGRPMRRACRAPRCGPRSRPSSRAARIS